MPIAIHHPNCRPAFRVVFTWLFIGAVATGERGAILYTLVESCRRRGLDPYAYLRDVLTRLPQMTNWQIKDVTPEAWAKAQENTPEESCINVAA